MACHHSCSNNKPEWKLDSGAIARGNSSAGRNIPALAPPPLFPNHPQLPRTGNGRSRKKKRKWRRDPGQKELARLSIAPLSLSLAELSGTLIALTAFCAPRDG